MESMELFGVGGASAAARTAARTRENAADSVFFGILSSYAAANGEKTEEPEAVQSPTLEEMLRAKYPRIAYHVFDASSGYWRSRNDYPHYLLYQDGGKAAEVLENWKPSGPNPFYGSIDGKFIAPKEIRALGSVPIGSRAVVIHPKAQERMEEDPEFALEIMARIEAWWAFDSARNEAMMPGIEARSSWSVAIGENGEIVNAQSHSAGEITTSKGGKDDKDDEKGFWELRLERHAYFMEQVVKKQISHTEEVSRSFLAANAQSAAKARLAEMLGDEGLAEILGETIAGVPVGDILTNTAELVFGVNYPKAKR